MSLWVQFEEAFEEISLMIEAVRMSEDTALLLRSSFDRYLLSAMPAREIIPGIVDCNNCSRAHQEHLLDESL